MRNIVFIMNSLLNSLFCGRINTLSAYNNQKRADAYSVIFRGVVIWNVLLSENEIPFMLHTTDNIEIVKEYLTDIEPNSNNWEYTK